MIEDWNYKVLSRGGRSDRGPGASIYMVFRSLCWAPWAVLTLAEALMWMTTISILVASPTIIHREVCVRCMSIGV